MSVEYFLRLNRLLIHYPSPTSRSLPSVSVKDCALNITLRSRGVIEYQCISRKKSEVADAEGVGEYLLRFGEPESERSKLCFYRWRVSTSRVLSFKISNKSTHWESGKSLPKYISSICDRRRPYCIGGRLRVWENYLDYYQPRGKTATGRTWILGRISIGVDDSK